MAKLDLLIQTWDEGHWEFTLAFEGLSDEDLWKRAHPSLLSIGELAGHVAYWEAKRMTGHLPPDSQTSGPLVDPKFGYYTTNIGAPVTLDLSVAEVLGELKRVHGEAKQALIDVDPANDEPLPGKLKVDSTDHEVLSEGAWGDYLRYLVFHVAYHTGQAYSVRHLFGHTPTNN